MTSQPARVAGRHAPESECAGDIRAVNGLLSACTFLDRAQSRAGPSRGPFREGELSSWNHESGPREDALALPDHHQRLGDLPVSASLAGVARGAPSDAPHKHCQSQWRYLQEFIQTTETCYLTIRECTDMESVVLGQWLGTYQTAKHVREAGLLGIKDIFQGHHTDDFQETLCTMIVQHSVFELLRRRNDVSGDCDSAFVAWKDMDFTGLESYVLDVISDKILSHRTRPLTRSLSGSFPGQQSLSDSLAIHYSGTQFHGNSSLPFSVTIDSLEDDEQPGHLNHATTAMTLDPGDTNAWTHYNLNLQTSESSEEHLASQSPWAVGIKIPKESRHVDPFNAHLSSFESHHQHPPNRNFTFEDHNQASFNIPDMGRSNHQRENTYLPVVGYLDHGRPTNRAPKMRESRPFKIFQNFLSAFADPGLISLFAATGMDCGLDNQLALVVSSAERVRRDEFNYRIRTMLLDSLPLPQISYTNCNIISGIIAATWYMVSLNILNCLRDVEEYMMDLAKNLLTSFEALRSFAQVVLERCLDISSQSELLTFCHGNHHQTMPHYSSVYVQTRISEICKGFSGQYTPVAFSDESFNSDTAHDAPLRAISTELSTSTQDKSQRDQMWPVLSDDEDQVAITAFSSVDTTPAIEKRCTQDLCTKIYRGKYASSSLSRHMREKHHGHVYTCPYCDRTDGRSDNLGKHIETSHPGKEIPKFGDKGQRRMPSSLASV